MTLRKELDKHLSTLKDHNIISTWTDSDIGPGTEWEPQIREKLNNAQIILLLISANFTASEFCRRVEMGLAIKRHKANTARVIPIILRPVLWEIMPFSELQVLPLFSDNRPRAVTSWPQRDDAWKNIVLGIKDIADDLEQKEKKSTP